MWTRNDDIRHGRMRPASHHKLRATYAAGEVLSYDHRMASVTTDFGDIAADATGISYIISTTGIDGSNQATDQAFFTLTQSVPYNFGAVTQSLHNVDLKMHTGSWRGVFSPTVRAAEEILVDELAKQLGKDPFAFRLEFLKDARARNVLRKVASAGNWGRSMPAGRAQGIAVHHEFRSYVAYLVEIDCTDRSAPRVTKGVAAVDVGQAINPRGVEAQLMGCLIDGISTVLQAGVHIDKGAVREGSYADFRWAQQRDAPPEFEAYVLPSGENPGGVGELGVAAAGGAVANAYARATRTKPRSFPINF